MAEFLIRAALAGLAVALAAGPLGAFVIWRRMAFFGDAVAHASILGVALALMFSMPVGLGTFAVALMVGAFVAFLIDRGQTGDAALGVLSHTALALGLVVVSLLPGRGVNVEALLFGDVLTVTWTEVVVIWVGAVSILALLVSRWQALVLSSINEDMAVASGIRPSRERLVLTLCLALLVAIGLKIVGALLIAALLVIPAAAARNIARSPEQMAGIASLIGAASVLLGLIFSFWADSPAGPTIVTVSAVCYALGLLSARARG